MGSLKIILKLWYFAVSLTCGHFGSTEDSAFGPLHRIIGSVQFIVRNRMYTGHSAPTCMNQRCHMNGCSNTNAELTCGLVQVEILTFVFEIDVSIIHGEYVDLNAAYVFSRSYRIRMSEGREKDALQLRLLGLQQCNLCQEASQRILGDKSYLLVIRGGSNLNVRRTTPGAVEIPSCRRDALISTSIYCKIYPAHTSHLSR